jgi:hypothetical protein
VGVISLRGTTPFIHSSASQSAKTSPSSNTTAVGERAKARGLGASAREARGDVGHAPDVAGSQSPTSPAACERRRNNPARTALGARSSACGVDARWLWRGDGRADLSAVRVVQGVRLDAYPQNGRLVRRCAEVKPWSLGSAETRDASQFRAPDRTVTSAIIAESNRNQIDVRTNRKVC